MKSSFRLSLICFTALILNFCIGLNITQEHENELFFSKVFSCFHQNVTVRNAPRDSIGAKLLTRDPSIELFNIFDSTDISNINQIYNCMEAHFPNSTDILSNDEYYGAGNEVTTMTGNLLYYIIFSKITQN